MQWVSLDIAIAPQRTSNGCWAAVASWVSRYYDANTAWTEEAVASVAAGPNQLWPLDEALRSIGHLREVRAGSLGLETLRSELSAGRPISARVRWQFGGAHAVLINGVSSSGAVSVLDPRYGRRVASLADLRDRYLEFESEWTHSYLTCPLQGTSNADRL